MTKIISILCLMTFLSSLSFAEALFPGHAEFEARGCRISLPNKMVANTAPGCGERKFCITQGAVFCTFVRSELLVGVTDWKSAISADKVPPQSSGGRINWIDGVTTLLCPTNKDGCENIDLDKCANFNSKEMKCTMKNMGSLQTIPRNSSTSGAQ